MPVGDPLMYQMNKEAQQWCINGKIYEFDSMREDMGMFGRSIATKKRIDVDDYIEITKVDNGFILNMHVEDKNEKNSTGYPVVDHTKKYFVNLSQLCDFLKDNYK